MSDEQLNTAIDEAARQMTDGSPAGDAGFRRRVLARIEAGDAPRARWRPLFVIAPLAAAIVIAVVVTRSRPAPFVRGVPSSTEITAGSTGPAPHETGRRPGPFGPGDRQTVRGPAPSASARQEAARAPAKRAEATAARRPFGSGVSGTAPRLDPLDAIAIAPLGVDPLAPDPISIERLGTSVPLVVAPLDSIEEQRRNE
jgi:hypothetical protein